MTYDSKRRLNLAKNEYPYIFHIRYERNAIYLKYKKIKIKKTTSDLQKKSGTRLKT